MRAAARVQILIHAWRGDCAGLRHPARSATCPPSPQSRRRKCACIRSNRTWSLCTDQPHRRYRVYDRFVTGPSEQIAIIPARATSLEDLNRLIARSKAYWDWPNEYLSRAIPLHRITPSYLSSNRCFEVVTEHAELLGFLSLTEGNDRVVIDNLWIEPEHIRRGIGRAAVHFAFELARASGWPHLWVLPDPPAEGFYRALGFSDTGERVPSRVSGGPVFSVYRISTPGPLAQQR